MFWHVISCFDMSHYVLTCHVMFWHVVLSCSDMSFPNYLTCFDMSHHILTCHIMFWHVILCFGMTYCVLTCDIMFWHVTSCLDNLFHHVLTCCFLTFWYVLTRSFIVFLHFFFLMYWQLGFVSGTNFLFVAALKHSPSKRKSLSRPLRAHEDCESKFFIFWFCFLYLSLANLSFQCSLVFLVRRLVN